MTPKHQTEPPEATEEMLLARPWSGAEEEVPIGDTGDADVPFVIRDSAGKHVLTLYEEYGRSLDHAMHIDKGELIVAAVNAYNPSARPSPEDRRLAEAVKATETLSQELARAARILITHPCEVYGLEQLCRRASRALAATLPPPADRLLAEAAEEIERLWQNHLDRDDRNSPEEYPDMALITFEEFREAILHVVTRLRAAQQPAGEKEGG